MIKCRVESMNWDASFEFGILGLTEPYNISSMLGINLFRGGILFFFFPKLKISIIHRRDFWIVPLSFHTFSGVLK